MSIYEQAMNDPVFRKIILIEFGFGEHKPLKVENWLKKNYTYKVNEWKKQAVSQKVVPIQVEAMTKEKRSKILDAEEAYSKMMKESMKFR